MNINQAAELKATFDRDGFVILRHFISAEQVEEIARRGEAAIRIRPAFEGPFTNITKGLERLDPYFEELLHNGPHVPLLEMLLGQKPEPTTASFFTKTKNEQQVHPHSDAIEGGVIWVALDDTNRENGCLHFLRGSHQRQAEFAHLKAHEPTDLSDHPDCVEAAMSAGDLVLFRPTTVHWSGPNHNGSRRRGFNCFYTGHPAAMSRKKMTDVEWQEAVRRKQAGQASPQVLS